jgi:mevalonate kinase
MGEARAVGALAAKPTGSGGGGCALALLDPLAAETQLAALRERLGAARVHGVSLP